VNQFASGLYAGVVSHARLKPRPHSLRYRVFMLLLDLDELTALDRALRLFGHNRFSLIGFHEADHMPGRGQGLKARVEAQLREAGLDTGGAIRLLCMPRIMSGVFNPISVYFCHRRDGTLSAMLYEVRNTFGERHGYLIPATDGPLVRQACRKAFYVSPFMDMNLAYAFRILTPEDSVAVAVDVNDLAGPVLRAAFTGAREELSDKVLLRAWLTHPMMTLGVMAAIHWEALKIWLKGEKIRARPKAPARAITIAPAARAEVA
jgi:uncharacterized protein